MFQVAAETFSASLLIPFLNLLQNTGSGNGEINIILQYFLRIFPDNAEKQFINILIVMISLMSLSQVILIINNKFILNFSVFTVQNNVSVNLFNKVLNSRIKFIYKKRSGELINNLTMDVNRAYNCIKCLLDILSSGLFIVGYFILGFILLPLFSFGLLLFMIVLFFLIKQILPYINNLGKKNIKAQENANNIIVEGIQGLRSIILTSMQKQYLKKYNKSIHTFYHTIATSSWITTSLPIFVRALSFIVIGIILYFGSEFSVNNKIVNFSEMMFFIFITVNIFKNIGMVNSTFSSFVYSFNGLENLKRLSYDLNKYLVKDEKNININQLRNNIKVVQLSFAYNHNNNVLNNIIFIINRNEKIAFVGKSGSGKSTIIDIITGFHDDYSGEIFIDEKKFKDINKDSWRKILGYVSQESFIFNDTVKNNLLFGLPNSVEQNAINIAI